MRERAGQAICVMLLDSAAPLYPKAAIEIISAAVTTP
jgi:hypothetical protein